MQTEATVEEFLLLYDSAHKKLTSGSKPVTGAINYMSMTMCTRQSCGRISCYLGDRNLDRGARDSVAQCLPKGDRHRREEPRWRQGVAN